ncbi:MAG: hypothetical protein GY810_16585 [Aureispira sp.]|nr:hypothetical protein [Aureispira sp.]
MKRPSEELFFLIKSLTKSEKRYFKQYAHRHIIGEQNNYVELFDRIESQDKYNEQELKVELKDSSYVDYLAVAKRYLYQQVLESLHNYHQVHAIEEKIKKHIHFAKILWQKKLLKSATKELKKVKKWIDDHFLWDYLPEYTTMQRRILRSQKQLTPIEIDKTYLFLEKGLFNLARSNDYWRKSHEIIGMHYAKVNVAESTTSKQLEQISQELKVMGLPTQPIAQIDYYKALATYRFMMGDAQGAVEYNQKLLNLFEENSYIINLEREQYIATLNNYLIDNHLLKNYEVLEKGILKLRALPKQKEFRGIPDLEVKILELTYSLQLNVYIAQGEFDKALEILPLLQKSIAKHKKRIALHYLLTFYYLIAYVYFRNKNYEMSLGWLEKIRQPRYKNLLEELMIATNRLYLITHFELGNYLLLDSLIAAVKRVHAKLRSPSKLEQLLFKYIKKLINTVESKKQKALYTAFAKDLLAIKQEEQRAWNYFDYNQWLMEKV